MHDRQTHLDDLIGRRRDWIPVAVSIRDDSATAAYLARRSRELRWQLVDLFVFRGSVPKHVRLGGAIVNNLPSEEITRKLLNLGLPTVRIGKYPHDDDGQIPAVIADYPACGRLAVEHFVKREFRNVAFVARFPWGDNRPLYDAFAGRAAELGCRCHLQQLDEAELRAMVTPERDTWEVQKQFFTEWVKALPKPVGLLAGGDYPANRFCHWAMEAGIRVPEELAVLGIGNRTFVCESAVVPISSIDQNEERIAEVAMETLRRRMAGESVPPTTIVEPAGVVKRQSTDVVAASDPKVVAAVQFMWDHVSQNLSVDDIAQKVGVPRRTLERAFQNELGRGIGEEFQRRRLEKVGELLRTTELQVSEIADLLSFSSAARLCRVFRGTFGLTPVKYRRQKLLG